MGSSRSFSISTPEHRSFFFANPSTSFTRKSIPTIKMRPFPSASAAADQSTIAPFHSSSAPPSSSSSPDYRTRSPSPPSSEADGAEVRETSGSIPTGSSTRDEAWHQYKGSPQLSRWARSRRNGSGRRSNGKSSSPSPLPLPSALTLPLSHHDHDTHTLSMDAKLSNDHDAAAMDDDDKKGFSSHGRRESVIYMVSDGTGWTAEHCVNAALGQFEHCLVDQGCPVNTHLFSQVVDVERLIEIVRDAGRENATLIYTLADPALAETAKNACEMYGIAYLDLLGPITQLLGGHLGVAPLGLPRGAPGRTMTLSREYFRRIEAVEFTIKQDDGALPQNLQKADLILVGVSRTSKTPLSTYMAQKGYKVANVPLVLGIEPPKELFEVDQNKIYALTINPTYLHSIRTARSKTLGLSAPIAYSEMEHVKKELEFSSKLFMENPKWPVIEVTGKAIEETAAVILRIYHDRQGKHVMPRISHRY